VTSFDYSESSVAALDEWADRLWDPAGPRPGEAELDSNSKLMGAYLGEVIIRNLGGKWVFKKGEGMAQPAVEMASGQTAWVLNKAYKRQLNGRADAFTDFFLAARRLAESPTP
jgi:hypothetical protein